MSGYINQILDFINHQNGLMQFFIILLFTYIAIKIEAFIYKRIYATVKKTKTIWDESMVWALHRPIQAFIISVAVFILVNLLQAKYGKLISSNYMTQLHVIAIIVLVIWGLLRLIYRVELSIINDNTPDKYPADRTIVRAIGKVCRIIAVILGILSILQTLNVSISGLLAFGGIGGIAVGFAAKNTIANFFGGMTIYINRPFKVGDWIRSPDREIEGTVEYMGWQLTVIRTFDKRPLYVPNEAFTSISVENPSRMTNRRIKTVIGVRYDDAKKIRGMLKGIEKMLESHPDIDHQQTVFVNLVEFAASSLNFLVYCFTKTTAWVEFQAIQQDVYLKILDIIAEHGAACAFPTQTLHIPQGIAKQENIK